MKIKIFPANWEVFHDDGVLLINTDYINSDVYDSIDEVYEDIIEKIEINLGSLSEDDKKEVRTYCDIDFSSRF